MTKEEPKSGSNSKRVRRRRRNDKDSKNQIRNSKKASKSSHKSSNKDVQNDYKFLEINKLVKSYKPVTINGVPTALIIERLRKEEEEHEKKQQPNSLGSPKDEDVASEIIQENKAKKPLKDNQLISSHLANFFGKFPTSPIYLSFMIKPSDPEFPFDLDYLKFSICIPSKYPYNKDEKPTITVLNEEIPKGFSINIEKGFKRIASIALLNEQDEEISLVNGKGLLSQIQTLDKYLEEFLKQEKRETIKFVKQKRSTTPKVEDQKDSKRQSSKKSQKVEIPEVIPSENIQYRDQLINEVKNRSIDLKLFQRGSAESKFKLRVPVFNNHHNTIPHVWQKNHEIEVFLMIPLNYPKKGLSLSSVDNFSKNLILKYKEHDAYQNVKTVEKSLISNFNTYDFNTDNLLYKVNFLANNLGALCLSNSEFAAWKNNISNLEYKSI